MPTLKKKTKAKPKAAKTKTAAGVKKTKAKAKKTVKAAKTKVVRALAKVEKAGAALVAKIKKDLKPVKKPHRPPHRHPLPPGGNRVGLPGGLDEGGLTPGGGLDGGTTPIGGAAAQPQINDPLAGALVAAAVNLDVDCTTNRADLRYILEQTDVTPPSGGLAAAPMPNQFPATPAANNFTVTVPGANLAAGRVYRLRVFVNPNDGPTPPNSDFAINVNT